MSRAAGIVSVFAVGTGRLFCGRASCASAGVETDEINRSASAAVRIQVLINAIERERAEVWRRSALRNAVQKARSATAVGTLSNIRAVVSSHSLGPATGAG